VEHDYRGVYFFLISRHTGKSIHFGQHDVKNDQIGKGRSMAFNLTMDFVQELTANPQPER